MTDTELYSLPEDISRIIRVPLQLFTASFTIGTLIMAVHFSMPFHELLIAGLFYVVIAFLVNVVVFICLVVYGLIKWEYRFLILIRACILLINIPVAILYIYIIFLFPENLTL